MGSSPLEPMCRLGADQASTGAKEVLYRDRELQKSRHVSITKWTSEVWKMTVQFCYIGEKHMMSRLIPIESAAAVCSILHVIVVRGQPTFAYCLKLLQARKLLQSSKNVGSCHTRECLHDMMCHVAGQSSRADRAGREQEPGSTVHAST